MSKTKTQKSNRRATKIFNTIERLSDKDDPSADWELGMPPSSPIDQIQQILDALPPPNDDALSPSTD